MTGNQISPKGEAFLESRGICIETAVRYGIYTARWGRDKKLGPAADGDILVFPFSERGEVVGEKYRTLADKKFWQSEGGCKTFWNADALDETEAVSGATPVIITEGEMDALSAITAGYPLVVSVPSGGKKPSAREEGANADESTGYFEFMWNNRDRLKKVQRFIIASDTDEVGQNLEQELVRRLGASRCLFVTYPKGCKDLNDVLKVGGVAGVKHVIDGAQPYPLKGVYKLSEYPKHAPLKTFETGWADIDRHLLLFPGEFMVITGIPGHGKSSWVTNLLVNLAMRFGWKSAIFSPEMPVSPQYRDILRRLKYFGPPPEREEDSLDRWIDDHFVFIDSTPLEDLDDDVDLDWVLDKARDAVIRHGIRVLVIDPWNEVEHARRSDESMTDYIGRAIRKLKRFAARNKIVCIVVAHPTKEVGKDGKGRMPTLYDIEGSAHWYNKPDHGVIIHRADEDTDETVVRIAKVRFAESGKKGKVSLRFDKKQGRFYAVAPEHAEEYA